jgi:hypothetical protein
VAGSLACSQLAKPRTMVGRIASDPGEVFAAALTQVNASSRVDITRLAPGMLAAGASLKPREDASQQPEPTSP